MRSKRVKEILDKFSVVRYALRSSAIKMFFEPTLSKENTVTPMQPPFCALIKPLGYARPRFGRPKHELTTISGLGDRADPGFTPFDTRLDRPTEPLSFRLYR